MSEPVGTGKDLLGGPVSVALEADLRGFIRQHGVVTWLDSPKNYVDFIDRLAAAHSQGALPYRVLVFRGSYLALMMALDGVAAGTEKVPTVIYLPGVNKEAVQNTPLYELYQAGTLYQKGLETLVTEAASNTVRPEQLAATIARGDMTLDRADAWLQALLSAEDSEAEGGEWALLRRLKPTAVIDDLLTGGGMALGLDQVAGQKRVWERFGVWTGMTESWRLVTLPSAHAQAREFAFVVVSWVLGVEYVHDLKRLPVSVHLMPMVGLPRPVVRMCQEIAAYVRQHHAGFYQRTADETETLLADEVEVAVALDLGKIDTFRFEEDKVLKAALETLQQQDYAQAMEWAKARVEPKVTTASFWLREDPSRLSAWQLVFHAATLGLAIKRAGDRLTVGAGGGLEAVVDAYVERGAAVDQAHRQLEQRRVALLYPPVPEFETLRARLDGMRRVWRRWADAWAVGFQAICRTVGFLPSLAYQQRALFDEVVRPMTQEGKTTAYFVVDALRFEMGEELFQRMVGTPKADVFLKARLAELPTVTEVGMNVLAPVVHNGRLKPVMAADGGAVVGFQTGELRVFDPETRRRAMHDRVGGKACPWLTLDEVLGKDSVALKRAVGQVPLVVVFSQEIDAAGESGVGPSAFDGAMQKLLAAWRLLWNAGVQRFVFTSDHGFLLLDDATARAQPHGRRIDPKRRHVFSPVAADHVGEARVSLADLGYDGVVGSVMFPESTAVFDTGRRPMGFVHGGNSLQERVIPVLTVVHRTRVGGNTMQYEVVAKAKDGVGGMHCVEVKIESVAQGALEFGSDKELELAMRVADGDGVVVELCQTRGKARIVGGVVVTPVGESFELFFRLSGAVETRVLVELFHPSAVADVVPGMPEVRFAVVGQRAATEGAVPAGGTDWLEKLVDPGVRKVFEHLAEFGVVTEDEATAMLGGARGQRSFSRQLEEYVKKAPFGVRVEFVSGVKRYIREGIG